MHTYIHIYVIHTYIISMFSLQFGCIPVILSDDVVFAFSRESGGPLDAALFSLQVRASL